VHANSREDLLAVVSNLQGGWLIRMSSKERFILEQLPFAAHITFNDTYIYALGKCGEVMQIGKDTGKLISSFISHSGYGERIKVYHNLAFTSASDCTIKCWDFRLARGLAAQFSDEQVLRGSVMDIQCDHYKLVSCGAAARKTATDPSIMNWDLRTGGIVQCYHCNQFDASLVYCFQFDANKIFYALQNKVYGSKLE